MSIIRCIEVTNFRSIKKLEWFPQAGINCLIGPGDAGKSTVLSAIDLCLGTKRGFYFSDSDFYKLNVEEPICIEITLGNLEEDLLNHETLVII